jgi:crotonobetainyl-CoA:carnitine CoA-transferase CaiB-like acyl-CoA transferase
VVEASTYTAAVVGKDSTAAGSAGVPRPGPLTGVTVIDITTALAGPYATLVLAGLGARVIKVENPAGGDTCRHNPPYVGEDGVRLARQSADDMSVSSLNRLRNKLSVTLNLKHPRGRDVLRDLLVGADVLVENFSRGVLDRLGVGYAWARGVNPRLVYCSITGFGSAGDDDSGKAADTIIQALSGVMYTSGREGEPPVRVGFPLADLTAPLFGVVGVLAALHQARTTGLGQHVDVSMLGALTSLLTDEPFDALKPFGVPTRTGPTMPRLSPFGVFKATDGYVAICAFTDPHAHALFVAMGAPELCEDPRSATRDGRVRHAQVVDARVEAWTSARTVGQVLVALEPHRVPCAPVRQLSDAIRDPRVMSRGDTVPLSHPTFGQVADLIGTGLPVTFSNAAAGFQHSAPTLGQHNLDVYGGLGYSENRIADLRRDGVI